jgi:hypothetical protein
MGDSWAHRLTLKDCARPTPQSSIPRYVTGGRPAQLEDFGGGSRSSGGGLLTLIRQSQEAEPPGQRTRNGPRRRDQTGHVFSVG